MRIAVVEFEGRISPVFDSSRTLVYFEVSNGKAVRLGEEDISAISPARRPLFLRNSGVETLLCGGISHYLFRSLGHLGITVIHWLAGETGQVVASFATGGLDASRFHSPGYRSRRFGHCRGEGRGRRRGGFGRGGGGRGPFSPEHRE